MAFVGILVGAGLLVNKFLNIFGKIGNAFESFGKIGESISGVFNTISDSIKDLAKAKKFNMYTDGILNIAKAIAILAASLALLTYIDQGKLLGAVAALLSVTAGLVAVSIAAKKIDSTGGIVRLSGMAVALGVSLLAMSAAMKVISTIDPERITPALISMVSMIAAMGLVVAAYGKFMQNPLSAESVSKAGGMFLKMSLSLIVMAGAIKILSMISGGDLAKGLAVITYISAIFVALMALSAFSNGNAAGAGKMFTRMAVAIGILALDIKLLASLSGGDLAKGLAVITACSAIFGALTVLSSVAGENAGRAGTMFLKFSVAVGILAIAIKSLSSLSLGEVLKGTAVIMACETLFASLVVVSNLAGENADRAGNMFLKFSVAVGILALTIKLISGLSLGEVLKGMAVIAACEALFGAIIALSYLSGQNADKAGTMLLKMSAAIGILAVAMKLIGFLSMEDIAKGLAVMSAVSVLFGALIALSSLAGPYADKAGVMLMKMTVPIIAISAAIGILSLLDPAKVAMASASISAVMAVFALVVKAGSTFTASVGPIVALSVAIVSLGTVLYLLAGLPINQSIGAAASLSMLLLSLSASLKILNTVKGVSASAIVGLGAMVVAMGLIAVVLGLMQSFNIQPSIETASALSILLLAMSAVCVILAGVGSVAPAAIAGAAAFDAVVAIIGGLMIAIGALMTYVPQCEEFLDRGIAVLEKIGYGLGSFFGNIVGGFIGGVGSGLPEFATQLSQFMTNLQPFINGANSIDPSVGESMQNLAKAILIITAADVINGLTSWLTGGADFREFANQLSEFGRGLSEFGKNTEGINPESITSAANAAKILAEMAATIPNSGGLLGWFAGENDMSAFGSQLGSFGKALVEFSNNSAGIIPENVNKGVQAATSLAQMAQQIPNSGGLLGWFAGENDFATFSAGLSSFASSILSFSNSSAGIIPENVNKGVQAATSLAQMAQQIPNSGGLLSMFSGDNDLVTFGSSLGSFGLALTSFSTNVTNVNAESVSKGVQAAKSLAQMAQAIPDSGGLFSMFTGDNNLAGFGSQLGSFGWALSVFSTNVSGVDPAACSNAISTAKQLVTLVKSMSGIDTSGVSAFKNAINTLAGTNVNGFVAAFSGKAGEMKAIGSNLANAVASGFRSGASALTSAATSAVNSMANAINGKISSFKSAGTKCMNSFTSAIKSGTSAAKSAVSSMASSAASAASSSVSTFRSAGLACAQGFAGGIASGAYAASVQAYAMGRAAANAAKRAINSHSPSKVFKKIGSYVPQGFAIGIGMYSDMVKKSTSNMANTAITGTRGAIAKISDAFSSDMDNQPTIRPVVDLDEVYDGAKAINNAFGLSPSVGVLSSVGSINSMMNRRSQNGTNNDVISAIKDLDKTIAKSGGNSYTINGVTYEDGSAVSKAIETLVRATRIERRV